MHLLFFRTLEGLGQIIKSHPSVQDIEDEKFDLDFSVFLISSESQDKFLKELKFKLQKLKKFM